MRFDELASRAGKSAADVGRRAERPAFSGIRRDRMRRTMFAGLTTTVALTALVLGSFWLGSGSATSVPPAAMAPTTTSAGTTPAALTGRDSCPVTEPGNSPFTPPSEAPEGPPELYDAVWYGTPELWTTVYNDGQVWTDLPVGPDGGLTQKTFWWAKGYVFDEEPAPDIAVTAEQIDGDAPVVQAGSPGTNATNPDLGSFMIVGLEIPQEGCWRVTARYRDATLSYVVWVGA